MAENKIPSERNWKRVVLDTPDLILAARNREEAKRVSADDRTLPDEQSSSRVDAVRLKSGKANPDSAVYSSQFIPVVPDTLFRFRVKCSGDLRFHIAEYDADGGLIGRQWTNSTYLERGRSATYSVETTEWTHWIVVMIDNPGFEESEILAIRFEQGLWTPKSEGRKDE